MGRWPPVRPPGCEAKLPGEEALRVSVSDDGTPPCQPRPRTGIREQEAAFGVAPRALGPDRLDGEAAAAVLAAPGLAAVELGRERRASSH